MDKHQTNIKGYNNSITITPYNDMKIFLELRERFLENWTFYVCMMFNQWSGDWEKFHD